MHPIHAGLAALAVATTLSGPARSAPQDVPKPGAVATESCTVEQLAILEEAFKEAAQRTQAAIDFLDANPQHAHVRRWFGTANPKLVRVNLALVAAALQLGSRPTLRCDATAPRCGNALAIASRSARTINFCAGFFRRAADGQDSRFGVVVHEVSHVAVGTRDAMYRPGPTEALARDEPAVAVTNADSYEYFVETLPR